MNQTGLDAEEKAQNRRWLANVQPANWKNPQPAAKYNLVVLGAGPAGLTAALAAAEMGAKVALVEARRLGGNRLNTGCVPCQSLIKSASLVREVHRAVDFGVGSQPGKVDFVRVLERVRRLRSELSWNDSAARVAGLGVEVFFGSASFLDEGTVGVDGVPLRFAKALIATGSRPALPEVPGLEAAGYLINETVFEIRRLPARLAVIGGGPQGCELGQAFLRLGSRVLLLQNAGRLLEREDADAAQWLLKSFQEENLEVALSAALLSVERRGSKKIIHYLSGGQEVTAAVDEILVAAGRRPGVAGLNLAKAGVNCNPAAGVEVDEFLQTANPHIYAAGDVCTWQRFSQAAEAMGRLAVRNALFPGKLRLDLSGLPRCTHTDPQVAQVGRTETELKTAGVPFATITRPLTEAAGAALAGENAGFVKLHYQRNNHRLLGVTWVGARAGEMLAAATLALQRGLKLSELAKLFHPYPSITAVLRPGGWAQESQHLTPRRKAWAARYLSWQRR